MSDLGLTNLLKWSVENSDASRKDPNAQANKGQNLNTEALAALFGATRKSDAQLMEEEMENIEKESLNLEARIQAFDNFEQLIENIDNANNLEPLKLWGRLVKKLEENEVEFRSYAAWCCATAVENNIKSQERVNVLPNLPKHHWEAANTVSSSSS